MEQGLDMNKTDLSHKDIEHGFDGNKTMVSAISTTRIRLVFLT